MNLLSLKKRKARLQASAMEQLGTAVHRRQLQLANYLNRKTQYWNRASKIMVLTLFCLVFGGASLYLLIKAFI